MRAFITGGTGFIGGHVVDRLLGQGHSVRLLSRKPVLPPRWEGRDVAVVQGDLLDAEAAAAAMKGSDVVFHIGEIKNTTASASEKNVDLVRKMTGELKYASVKRFVFVSSVSVAGVPSASRATEEDEPAFALRDMYTEYKRRAEELVRQSYNGAEHAIVRPGIVYGPGSRHLGSMLRAVAKFGPIGIPFIGSGRNKAPFVQVQDLAQAIVLAGTRPEAANQTFNVTDATAHTWAEFFSAIGRAQGKDVRLVPLPPFLLRLPAVFADLFAGLAGFQLDLNHYITFMSRSVDFDPEKARRLLGWEPEHGDLAAAIREMVDSYGKKEQ